MTEDIPNWILSDTRGENEECWKNTNTLLYIMEGDYGWVVRGENSRLYPVEDGEQLSYDEAREKAVEWMRDTPRPSPMV